MFTNLERRARYRIVSGHIYMQFVGRGNKFAVYIYTYRAQRVKESEVHQYLTMHEAIYKLKPSTTNWIPGIVVGATATKHGLQLLCAKLLAPLLHH